MSEPIDLRGQGLILPNQLVIPDVYKNDLEGILIPEGTVKSRVAKMAEDISKKHSGHDILAICVLDGAIPFFKDLIYSEQMSVPVEIETLRVKSYDGTKSTGQLKTLGFDYKLAKGRHVIAVDDIGDTRRTLDYIERKVLAEDPLSFEKAVLLNKPSEKCFNVSLDYCGFIISNVFVVGYGLDFNNKFRGLNHIGVLKPEVYSE